MPAQPTDPNYLVVCRELDKYLFYRACTNKDNLWSDEWHFYPMNASMLMVFHLSDTTKFKLQDGPVWSLSKETAELMFSMIEDTKASM